MLPNQIHETVNAIIQANSSTSSTEEFYSPVALWVFIIVTIGAVLLFLSFLPGWINTVKTKDTSSMSLSMWIISVVGLTFLTLFYALGVGNTATNGDVSVQFLIVLICEGLSLILSIYILIFKLWNMKMAKKLGISEKEYCYRLKHKNKK